jgi:hypothetical protein
MVFVATLKYKLFSMRKILQISLFFLAANLIIPAVPAQLPKLPKVLAFGNVTYANPSNADFKNISNHGLGVEVGAGLGLGKTILMASVGHMSYNIPTGIVVNGVTLSGQPDHLKVTPLKLGIRKYLIAGLFLNGNVGIAMQKYDKYSATSNSFLYEFGAGFKFLFLELGAAYTGYKMAGTSINANSILWKGGVAIKI